MIDYTIFYKRELPVNEPWPKEEAWDVFISAYVPGDRTKRAYEQANAPYKWWLLFPEYGYGETDRPGGNVFQGSSDDEASFIAEFWELLPTDASKLRLCIDISGFIRPYLIFLVRWLLEKGVTKVDAIYSEPVQYKGKELTEFSGNVVREVRQVSGCEGLHVPDNEKDVLIIGAGYEDTLISHVADSKAKATKLQLIGFPSLRADMYQENVLRIRRAEESLGDTVNDEIHTFFAPANDPFVAATELSRTVQQWEESPGITNLYLCPLSTKVHVLGFALFYVTERRDTATSILFPFEERYSQSPSKGVARTWKYTVELPSM